MTPFIAPAMAGFALGASLIIAIGAQNAFVLRMGLMRSHVFAVCAICALSDAVLIVIGVAGLGSFVDRYPAVLSFIRIAGAAFLLGYAVLAARRALRPGVMKLGQEKPLSLAAAVGMCAAFTFLNPHVYLDTVVLVGGLASSWNGALRVAFTVGAVASSFVWFFGLGYGARLLVPLFEKPVSWRVLDTMIAAVMAWLAISLIWPLLG